MNNDERDAVIDECIGVVLSVRPDVPDGKVNEAAYTAIQAACYRLTLLKTSHADLRQRLADQGLLR